MPDNGFIHICLTANDDGDVTDAKVVDTNLDNDEIKAAAMAIWYDKDRHFDEIVADALLEEVKR